MSPEQFNTLLAVLGMIGGLLAFFVMVTGAVIGFFTKRALDQADLRHGGLRDAVNTLVLKVGACEKELAILTERINFAKVLEASNEYIRRMAAAQP